MRYGLSLIVTLAWALWLGGLMTLFLTVSHLFKVNRPTAVTAAPEMFIAFERYQIILAGVALIAAAAWRLTTPRALLTALFFLLAIASVGTVLSAAIISPRMHAIRALGESSGPAFRRLHGMSMMAYTGEAVILLAAGCVLIASLRRTDSSTAPASAPRAEPGDPVPSP
jgi:hypothetical protein